MGAYRDMARKTRPTDSTWKGFVDRPLTAQEREQCIAWGDGQYETDELLEQLCVDGYKVSITYNPETASHICALTGTARAGKNAGYTMSSHAKTVRMATQVAAFKHYVLLAEDWDTARLNKDGDDFG